jgi:hypothetical protein
MSQYIFIQNQFEAPADGFTTLGLSTANERTIGQFGSGSNHGILCCLRAGLDVIIYCGKTKLTFSTKTVIVKEDGLEDRVTRRVTVKRGYNMERVMDIDLNFGRKDWTNVGMALREFISNAIDRHSKTDEGYEPAMEDGRLRVSLVNEREVRAKAGFTRVYVQVNDEVRAYFANLGQNFLHFSDNPGDVHKGLIPRASGPARIFRCGVFVMQVDEVEGNALFDYNFKEDEIDIDESRNSNIYVVRAACAAKLREAEKEEVVIYLKSLVRGSETFESKLEPERLLRTWDTPSDRVRASWAAGAKAAFGDAYLVSNNFSKGALQKRGHEAVLIANSNLVNTLQRLGVQAGRDILSETEQKGIEVVPATPAATAASLWAWGILDKHDLTFDKPAPGVLCFSKEGEPDAQGFKEAKVIHLPVDIQGDTAKREALRLTIEYVAPGKKIEVLTDLALRGN